MVDPSLVKGITEALVGGFLGATDALGRGDTNNLGAFLQAQQNAIEKVDRNNSRAYGAFNDSVRAIRTAALVDPEAYKDSLPIRLSQLRSTLDSIQDPNLVTAGHSALEALESEYNVKLGQQKVDLNSAAGLQGRYGWLDDTPESQEAIARLYAPGSSNTKVLEAMQNLDAQIQSADEGDVTDLAKLPGSSLTPELSSVLAQVRTMDGGFLQWAASNPDKAGKLATDLSKIDQSTISGITTDLTDIRDTNLFLNATTARASALNAQNVAGQFLNKKVWQKDPEGTFSPLPSKQLEIADAYLQSFEGNAWAANSAMLQVFGETANMANVTTAIYRNGDFSTPTSDQMVDAIDSTFTAGEEIIREGAFSLTRDEENRIMRGDLKPLRLAGLSEQAAPRVMVLMQGRGAELMLNPMLEAMFGTAESREAEFVTAQRNVLTAEANYGKGTEQFLTATAGLDRLRALKLDPGALDNAKFVMANTLQVLGDSYSEGTLDRSGVETYFANLAAAKDKPSLLTDKSEVTDSMKTAIEVAMADGLPPAVILQNLIELQLAKGLVFAAGRDADVQTAPARVQAAVSLRRAAGSMSRAISQQSRRVDADAAQAFGLPEGMNFRPQVFFLNMINIKSMQDLTLKPKEEPVPTPEQREAAIISSDAAQQFQQRN